MGNYRQEIGIDGPGGKLYPGRSGSITLDRGQPMR